MASQNREATRAAKVSYHTRDSRSARILLLQEKTAGTERDRDGFSERLFGYLGKILKSLADWPPSHGEDRKGQWLNQKNGRAGLLRDWVVGGYGQRWLLRKGFS
jgi:hypothetical protein